MILNMDRVLRVGGTAARLAGVPVVLPRRGSDFALKPGLLYRLTYRHVATGVIVNSRTTAANLASRIRWRPAGAVHVLPNHVELARFASPRPRAEVRAELGLPADGPVAICVGELTSRKNAALAIRALPEILGEVPDAWLLIVGKGREEEAWRGLARSLGVASRVCFAGFRRDVPDLLAAADVLVHASRAEGLPNAVTEAMAAGRPVVASDASSHPELVDDGTTGRLFAPDDASALAAAVVPYLRDRELRLRHGAAGRERAEREFSLEHRLAELEALLEREIAVTTRG